MFCKHDWELKDKTILPANLELLQGKLGSADIPHQYFVKKLIVLMACKKCGKLSKTVEKNQGVSR